MHIGLWLAQVALAIAFGMAGLMKLLLPLDELAANLVWPADVPGALVRLIGLSETAGAIGVVVPAATRIRPGLTVAAAIGLAVVMLLAFAFHLYRAEMEALPINLALGGLAVFVAWGRSKRVPIRPRRGNSEDPQIRIASHG